jgi:hypothetical protein
VYGVAIPTVRGLRNVLDELGAANGEDRLQKACLMRMDGHQANSRPPCQLICILRHMAVRDSNRNPTIGPARSMP